MKTKPILFSTPMVQAILEGRKTQTRRIVKHKQKIESIISIVRCVENEIDWDKFILTDELAEDFLVTPKYQKDDILWVRETFTIKPYIYPEQDWITYLYKASDDVSCHDVKWKPSIFMPKEAARIFIKVTNIHVQRLHDISESDAIAEGIIIEKTPFIEPINAFASLWQKINGNWEENPFVWVYEFERTEKPENFI